MDFVIDDGKLIKYHGLEKEVIIPDGVTSIGVGAFWWCDNITSIIIPDSVLSIGDEAFRQCKNLVNITIPNGVTSIGNKVF